MALSKILDASNNSIKRKTVESCELGVDCQYKDTNGNCSAEWCIYSQLPRMVNTSKNISCMVCGKSISVSVYSGITSGVCDECKEKIKKVTTDRKCPICGGGIDLDQTMCSNCSNRIKAKLNEVIQ